MFEPSFELTDEQIYKWGEEIEKVLPTYIDGIATEGEYMVNYNYIQYSLNLLPPIIDPDIDKLTACYLPISYLVKYQVISGEQLCSPVNLNGYVEIPVALNGELMLTDIDFLGGLKSA